MKVFFKIHPEKLNKIVSEFSTLHGSWKKTQALEEAEDMGVCLVYSARRFCPETPWKGHDLVGRVCKPLILLSWDSLHCQAVRTNFMRIIGTDPSTYLGQSLGIFLIIYISSQVWWSTL